VDDKEELDAVKAQPGRGSDVQARFDTVVVSDTDDAENTGLKGESFSWLAYLITYAYKPLSIGMKIGCLRVIFMLPELNIHGQPTPTVWPQEHLAYIEWYKLSARAGANHNMYLLSKPPASA